MLLAQEYWQNLQNTYGNIYADNFTYQGQECLFSLALNKLKGQLGKVQNGKIKGNKLDRLKTIFTSTNHPIRKEDLYELVYDKPYQDKTQIEQLKKLIYKFKKKHQFNISYSKGKYLCLKSAS